MRRDEMKTLSSVKGEDEVIFPLTLQLRHARALARPGPVRLGGTGVKLVSPVGDLKINATIRGVRNTASFYVPKLISRPT